MAVAFLPDSTSRFAASISWGDGGVAPDSVCAPGGGPFMFFIIAICEAGM